MKKTARRKKDSFVEKASDIVIESVVPEPQDQRKVKRFFQNKPFLIGLIVVLFIALGAGGLYAFLYFQKDATTGSNAQLTSDQIKLLVRDVGKLMVLPDGETPTIATVTDVEKLSEQAFFKTAQNGDKVLLFGSTKEAILYRPSIGKIIKVATINDTNISTPSPSLTPQNQSNPSVTPNVSKIKVTVLNGTQEAGLARKAAALLGNDRYEVSTSNANEEYTTTSVSKVSGIKVTDESLRSIASLMTSIKAQVRTLSNDETPPEGAEVVIILGSDFADAY